MSRIEIRRAAGGPVVLLAAVLVLSLRAAADVPAGVHEPPKAPPRPESACITCHAQLGGEAAEPTLHTKDDIHFLRGLSCNDCHGGNPAVAADDIEGAHDEKKGWKGKPARKDVPVFCGTCHGDAAFMKRFNPHTRVDQLSEYRTSVHGKRNAAGDEKVAVCVDCHGVHGIRAVADSRSSVYPTHVADTCARCHTDSARMSPYGLKTNQYAEYKTSVHARALYDKGDVSAPTCNDCHGSHGAVPPGVESVANVCGSCHGREATLFRETEAKRKINLLACIQCLVCHSNHAVQNPTDEMLGVGPKSSCTPCHPAGVPLHKTVEEMGTALAGLRDGLGEAKGLLDRAEVAGVEVGADRFALQKGMDQLVELKVLAHSFDRERFLGAATQGLSAAREGTTAGKRALAELRTRRAGLAVSLVVIVAVIAGLAAKVREIERK